MRRLALVIASLVLATSCTMTQSHRKAVILGGATSAVIGSLLVAAGPTAVDADHNGFNETTLDDDYTDPLLGGCLVMAGLAMITGGLATSTVPDPPESPAIAETTARSQRVAPLPELPVDADTLGLAQQARLAITAGHCESAQPLLAVIATRSPAYHQALIGGPVLDPCPGLRYISLELSR